MTTEAQLLAERAARVPEIPRLLSPHMTEAANMALEFVGPPERDSVSFRDRCLALLLGGDGRDFSILLEQQV